MKKVVITGMGAVTPIGNNVEEFTENLFSGKSGSRNLNRFDPAKLPTRFAAEVKNIESEFRDVKIDFALLAAREAMKQAFGISTKHGKTMGALSIGIGLELFDMNDLIQSRTKENPAGDLKFGKFPEKFKDKLTFLSTPSDLCVPLICSEHGLNEPPLTHISACAASTDAIGSAFLGIRNGDFDLALAGGADSMINPMGLGGFCRIGALSQRNETPETASRPFDKSRDGFVLGEGAGFLVLESQEHALERGAKIFGCISGYGNSLDGHSVSDPHPEGAGALAAMKKALASAKLNSDDISAVNAHGTGTPKNDPAECAALKTLFGFRASEVPISSTKSMIGHLISAGGVVESIAAIQCLRSQRVHHTINLKELSPECIGLKHVMERPLEIKLKHILKNSFAFGGQNACLILSEASC